MRRLELQTNADTAVRIRQLELQAQADAQKRKGLDNSDITLEDSVLQPLLSEMETKEKSPAPGGLKQEKADSPNFPISADILSSMQQEDESLRDLFDRVDPTADIQSG
uniref:Gypsy retrotransposon integrase 1 n=1 Tax=Nothobranchius pienaari TaxID=704102 RepID=A0A1A8MGA2_9TELE